jgi:hypothetical protein
MVWGMNHPPVSNHFYLAGEFEGRKGHSSGWRERLQRHFDHDMSAQDQAIFEDEHNNGAHWYACHAVGKFLLRRRLHQTVEDRPTVILSHEVPKYFHAKGNCSKLPSLALFAGPVFSVDEPLKAFIEWLEPGVHRFFPIEVRPIRGSPPPTPRYILVVEQELDSFSEEHSNKGSFRKDCDKIQHSEKPKDMRALAFRKADFAGSHLWYERRMGSFLLCISDRLQAEIADAGLHIPRHFQMKEV